MTETLPSHPCRLLVVDDEPAILKMLDLALCKRGFLVLSATTGAEAIELFRCHHRTLSLVLLDVQMAALDGPQTLAALRAIDPHVPCCFATGSSGSYTGEQLLAMGAVRILEKPFRSLDELARMLWEMCRPVAGSM